MTGYIDQTGGSCTCSKRARQYMNASLILVFIAMVCIIVYHFGWPFPSMRNRRRVRFTVNTYEDELNLYKSLSTDEQKEYLNMTKQAKIDKYYS